MIYGSKRTAQNINKKTTGVCDMLTLFELHRTGINFHLRCSQILTKLLYNTNFEQRFCIFSISCDKFFNLLKCILLVCTIH